MTQDFETAFATFLIKAQSASDADYVRSGCNPFHAPKLSAMHGKRYIRIVSESPGSRCSWAFIDQTNGDVLKADGWKAPAKGARGNIYDANNGCARVRWTSIR